MVEAIRELKNSVDALKDKNESVFFLEWAGAGLIGTDPISNGVCPN
jgi:hypothetical protein